MQNVQEKITEAQEKITRLREYEYRKSKLCPKCKLPGKDVYNYNCEKNCTETLPESVYPKNYITFQWDRGFMVIDEETFAKLPKNRQSKIMKLMNKGGA